jgi:hypothetical protein
MSPAARTHRRSKLKGAPSVAAATFGVAAPKNFKSDARRIRVLIRSLDSVQNAALLLPIGRQLLSQVSTAYLLTFEHTRLSCAFKRRAVRSRVMPV